MLTRRVSFRGKELYMAIFGYDFREKVSSAYREHILESISVVFKPYIFSILWKRNMMLTLFKGGALIKYALNKSLSLPCLLYIISSYISIGLSHQRKMICF